MNRAFEAAGLPHGFRFQDLRHTGNMWAAGSGANLRELMERMGHGSTRAALVYLHAASEGDRRIPTASTANSVATVLGMRARDELARQ